jgi:hypothetical protein
MSVLDLLIVGHGPWAVARFWAGAFPTKRQLSVGPRRVRLAPAMTPHFGHKSSGTYRPLAGRPRSRRGPERGSAVSRVGPGPVAGRPAPTAL